MWRSRGPCDLLKCLETKLRKQIRRELEQHLENELNEAGDDFS